MSEIAQKLADIVLGFGLTDKLGALIYPALAVTSLILLIVVVIRESESSFLGNTSTLITDVSLRRLNFKSFDSV